MQQCHTDIKLCSADIREVEGCSERSWQETLKVSCELSHKYLWAVFVDNELCAVYGLTALEGSNKGTGVPWLLSNGQAQEKYPLQCMRLAKHFMGFAECIFKALANLSCVGIDTKGFKWLRSLGFTFNLDKPHIFKYSMSPYYVFTKGCRETYKGGE